MRLPPNPNPPRSGRVGALLSRSIHIALLFVSHFFLGTFVAAWGSYQYEQSRWLSSLNQEQGKQLLAFREALLAAQSPAHSTPNGLQRDITRLEALRGRAPQDAQAILTLRIAADHALLARLYRGTSDLAAAETQAEAARSLLHELGWKDTSDEVVSALADRRRTNLGVRDVR
jgi:hypothetical protein